LILGFFNISGGEIFIVILVVFIIFGPDKIPEIARWIGKGVNEIKKATSEIREEIDKETGDIRKAANKIKDDFNNETKSLKDITSKLDKKSEVKKRDPHL
jgi:TatA/E family protein of Tat protein translocase